MLLTNCLSVLIARRLTQVTAESKCFLFRQRIYIFLLLVFLALSIYMLTT
jgi:hypothetical protein